MNLPSLPSNFGPNLARPSSTDELESFLINWQRQTRENSNSPRGDININNSNSNSNSNSFFKSPPSSSEKSYQFKNNHLNKDISHQFQHQYREQQFIYSNNNSINNQFNQLNQNNLPSQSQQIRLEEYQMPVSNSILDTNSRFLLQSDANTDLSIALGNFYSICDIIYLYNFLLLFFYFLLIFLFSYKFYIYTAGQDNRFETSLKSESTLVVFEDKPPSASE
jgi:hypothetical protein